jgi:gliding motility-associated-like protein
VAGPRPSSGVQFIRNQRQWDDRVLFAADVPGGRLFLERGRLMQARYDAAAVEAAHELPREKQATARIRAHAYAVEFVGANPKANVLGEDATGSETSYFIGNDPAHWAARVPGFGGVRYQGLYPGTDLRFYATSPEDPTAPDGIEYDFELAPGADPARIGLRYDGQTSLKITKDGALAVQTTVGEVREQRPFAYQLDAQGRRVAVRCHYVLTANHTVRFALPDGYDHARRLVIDPVLVYASYTGSTAANWGFTATHDPQGNLYSGSIAFAAGYPVSTGAYDTSFGGAVDIAIIKFDPNATVGRASRVWATLVGGSQEDRPHSMVVNQQGQLVVLGTTESSNFPTTSGAFDRSYNNNTDLVVFTLNPTGSAMVASTFLGGNGIDGVLDNASDLWNNYGDDYRGDITVDAQDNVYLTSVTRSAGFPTQNAFQSTRRGQHDAVVVKMPASLGSLTWSSFLGGSDDDNGYSIQVDSASGAVYVGGGTASNNMPSMTGLNNSYRGGTADGFIVRISPNGSSITNGTYLGTSAYDQAYFVQLDRQGAVYALGQTAGQYPVSAGVYSNPGSRQFIQKLDANLATSVLSTVIGNGNPSTNRPNLSPTAFLVDNCGQILLSGWGGGNIAGMPTTSDAILRNVTNSTGSITTAFGYFYIMQLTANAQALAYGTYYGNGSTHSDGGTSRFDKRGVVYQSVCVVETSGIQPLLTTPNAWSRARGATGNNAAFKMDVLEQQVNFTTSNQPFGSPNRTGCAPLLRYFNRPASSVLPGTTAFWDFGNGQTSNIPNNASTTFTTPGRYIVRLTVSGGSGCQQQIMATDTVFVQGVAKPVLGPDQTVCPGGNTILAVPTPDPAATYVWSPATGLNTTNGPTVTATPTATTTYTVVGTSAVGGCTSADTITVSVAPAPQPTLATEGELIVGQAISFPLTLTPAGTLATANWDFGDGQTSTEPTPTHTYTATGQYAVRVQGTTAQGCAVDVTLSITVGAYVQPNIITPNNDGKNDTFEPSVTADPVTLTVFNRWGRKVFEQDNYTTGWGTDVSAGTYYYRLTSASGQSWKGWVEVVK